MDTKEYKEKKRAYIWDELSEEDEARFKEELKRNPEEEKEVELQRRIIDQAKMNNQLEEILSEPGVELAKKEAEIAIKEYAQRKRREYLLSKEFRNKFIYPIAAVILIMLYLGNLSFFIINPDLAFIKYYKEYTPVYYAQATIDEAQELLIHSFDAYNKGDYAAVAENMHALMEEGNLNLRGQILLAFHDAWNLDLSKKIKQEKNEAALWYLAISSYKLNDLEKAQELFHEISLENHSRAKRAARMERKLGKMLLEK